MNSLKEIKLHEKYKDLLLIDTHNHDSTRYEKTMSLWDKYYVDKVCLFGYVSRQNGILTDDLAWKAYSEYPDRFYPFFSAFDMYSPKGIEMVRNRLEQGFLGIGEVTGASTYSEVLKTAEWKAEHPMDGNLPEVYGLAAKYKVPILLHIDPPFGFVIEKFEEALQSYPDTIMIFGHANVFNTPKNIQKLMEKYPNLYIDIFAGFTAYDESDKQELTDYVEMIESFPDRVLVSTDSGFGMDYEAAIIAMYELLDLLSPETARKVAHQNFLKLMENQVPTETQLSIIDSLSKKLQEKYDAPATKIEANTLIFTLQQKINDEQIIEVPNVKEAKKKKLPSLSDGEMIVIARDLLTKITLGLWSKDSEIKASEDWASFYRDIYFDEIFNSKKQADSRKIPALNNYEFSSILFKHEQLEKTENYFTYTGEVHTEKWKNSLPNEKIQSIRLYRLVIEYHSIDKCYKVKRQLEAEIER